MKGLFSQMFQNTQIGQK